ncbi:NgoBV family restriction endonuclease [Thiothrix subterranea]|nr:NgoBV family restriction endonuclease [Thiothrix subterranea]
MFVHPDRLDANHLVFGYDLEGESLRVVDFWVKKIWEMAGESSKNILSLQVKQNIPVNIRPKDWRTRDASFGNRRQFVEALDAALKKFYPERYHGGNWLKQVATGYQAKTGIPL